MEKSSRVKIKLKDRLGILQLIFYLISIILGIILCIGIGTTIRSFHGNCPFFAETLVDERVNYAGESRFTFYPWRETACEYVLYFNLAAAVVYAAMMAIFTFIVVLPRTNEKKETFGLIQRINSSFVIMSINPILTFINFFICVLIICSAAIVTLGYSSFCTGLVEKVRAFYKQPTFVCGDQLNWGRFSTISGSEEGIDGSSWFGWLLVSTIVSWGLAAVWVLQTLINFSMSCRVCSCEIAEEKRRPDKSLIIAQRRSRLATPILTPGSRTPGNMTPTDSEAMYGGAPPMHIQMQPQYGVQAQRGAVGGGYPMSRGSESSASGTSGYSHQPRGQQYGRAAVKGAHTTSY